MSFEGFRTSSRFKVPEFSGVVVAATSNLLSLGMIGNRPNSVGMSEKGFKAFSSLHVPQFDRAVKTATRQLLTIGTNPSFVISGKESPFL